MSEEKNLFEKNLEMWERWTNSYTDTMFKAMEKGMDQSAAFGKQVDEAVNKAVHAQGEAMLTALKALEHQVEVLTEKIDEMLQVEEKK